jgi:hypothetical protein
VPLSFAATAAAPSCAAAGQHHAALVIEHGDGSVTTRCVAFDTDTITGQQLLDASGIKWTGKTFSFGEAICALDGEPASFAQCPAADKYWALFDAKAGGSWQMASVGISDLKLSDGDAEGLHFVPASETNPGEPPSPATVCSAAAASAVQASPAPASSASSSSSGINPGILVALAVTLGLVGLATFRILRGRRTK